MTEFLQRVISGGQTGVDQTALLVARKLDIPTGGTAPKGWRTDEGPAPWLADYGLVQSTSAGYSARTAKNVYDSCGTVLFGIMESRGCALTIGLCGHYDRPYLINPGCASALNDWLDANMIKILNVAGNRRLTNPQAAIACREVLELVLLPF